MSGKPSTKVWIVGADDPRGLGELVMRAGGDAQAIADGRVFVGRARATSAVQPLNVGDEVTISAAGDEARGELRVLHRGADFVAVHKPAGMVTIPDLHGSAHALSTRLAKQLGMDPRELHPTSRLDREVSGVVVFTTTREAAARLSSARDEGRYARRYLAIASGKSAALEAGTWEFPIGRDRDPRRRKIQGRDPVAAVTRYAVVARCAEPGFVLLALAPQTGRTHQLRLHASHVGVPLLGDRVYGGGGRLSLPNGRVVSLERIFLHAARVTLPGPTGELITVTDEVPPALRDTWALLGGEPEGWDRGLACSLD